ncbi:MAG: hypothetical protein ACE5HS_12250 [bacterium]
MRADFSVCELTVSVAILMAATIKFHQLTANRQAKLLSQSFITS